MRNHLFTSLFISFALVGCTQKPAEIVHKGGGVYSPTYSEVYVESPDGKIARSLRGNSNSERAQTISIINRNAIIEENNSESYYTVQNGDSLWSVSRKYGMTVPEVIEMNNLNKPYTIRPGQKIKVGGGGNNVSSNETIVVNKRINTYTVQSGDTLSTIAEKFNMKTTELAELNNIDKPYSIKIGQKLKINEIVRNSETETATVTKKTQGIYIVESGDNLSSIASKNNMSFGELAEMNNLKSPYQLKIGQKLKVNKDAVIVKSSNGSSGTNTTPTPIVATKSSVSSSSSKNSFIWPVKGEIVSSFGNKSNGLYNDGINIAAQKGVNFKASESGVVAYVGNELRGYGTIVLIKHDNNWISAYAHCGSVKVARGDKVERGQIIGTIGQTGNVTTPQLYFSLRNGREAVDPLKYLDK